LSCSTCKSLGPFAAGNNPECNHIPLHHSIEVAGEVEEVVEGAAPPVEEGGVMTVVVGETDTILIKVIKP